MPLYVDLTIIGSPCTLSRLGSVMTTAQLLSTCTRNPMWMLRFGN